MAEHQDTRISCFHCGNPVGDPPTLNELGEGGNCPACAERLLETLPPIFHEPWVSPSYEEAAAGDDDEPPAAS